MVVVRITSQLANQMFAYASVKTIAEEHGYEFKYIHEYCLASERSNATADKKYGSNFDTIFSIPAEEKLLRLDESVLSEHEEYDYIKKYDSFYYHEAVEISDNTYMKGHFISPKYFIHNLSKVKEWFRFPEDIDVKSTEIIQNIRDKSPKKKIVSVHFRVGNDYLLRGYLMNQNYWLRAAERMLQKYGEVKFIVFCDKRTHAVNTFLNKYDCHLLHGSLVEDLCCMTKCDAYIISNSTFSLMGALLSDRFGPNVVRPSHYFTGFRTEQKNCFLDEWEVVNSKRDFRGFLLSFLKIGSIRNKLYDLTHPEKR